MAGKSIEQQIKALPSGKSQYLTHSADLRDHALDMVARANEDGMLRAPYIDVVEKVEDIGPAIRGRNVRVMVDNRAWKEWTNDVVDEVTALKNDRDERLGAI